MRCPHDDPAHRARLSVGASHPDLHDSPGELFPLIDWEDLTPAARHALNHGDYGAGTPLMRDGAFEHNVYHSWAGDPALIMDLRNGTRPDAGRRRE